MKDEADEKNGTDRFRLTVDETGKTAGLPIGRSFPNGRKELLNYGYKAGKTSLKGKTAGFEKGQGKC